MFRIGSTGIIIGVLMLLVTACDQLPQQLEIDNGHYVFRYHGDEARWDVYAFYSRVRISKSDIRFITGEGVFTFADPDFQRQVIQVPFEDALGAGQQVTITVHDPWKRHDAETTFKIYDNADFLTAETRLTNTHKTDITIHALQPLFVQPAIGGGITINAEALVVQALVRKAGQDTREVVPLSVRGNWPGVMSWGSVALLNPITSQAIILGFITRPDAKNFFRVSLDGWKPEQKIGPPITLEGTVVQDFPTTSGFVYRADMRYPPTILKPGETLSSGVLLIKITDVPDRGLTEWDRLAARLAAPAGP